MRKVIIIIILILLVVDWFSRLQLEKKKYSYLKAGDEIKITGLVTNQPYQKGSKQIIRVGSFLVFAPAFPRYFYADKVMLSGRLVKELTNFKTQNLLLIDPSIEMVNAGEEYNVSAKDKLIRQLALTRTKLMQKISTKLPEPHASLISGILLGVKRGLPENFYEALRRSGTLHVVVASGYNVSVVAGVVAVIFLRFFSRKWAIPGILTGIAFYTLLAGAEPPILRASIMAGLSYLAQFLGKQSEGLWTLFIAALIMVLISPMMVFDIGFQLSVAATLGILVLFPVIYRFIKRRAKWIGKLIGEELSVTLAAQLMVVPIIALHFGSISLLSPLANLIIAPLVPVIMGMGGALVVLSFLWYGLGQVFALLCWVPAEVFIKVVGFFGRLPFGVLEIEKIHWVWVLVYYLLIFYLVMDFSKSERGLERRMGI